MALSFQPVGQQFVPQQQQPLVTAKDSKLQQVQQLQQLQQQLHTMMSSQQQQDQMPLLSQQQQQALQQNNWQNQAQYPVSNAGVDVSDPQQLQQFLHFQRLSQIYQIQQLTQQKQQEIQELHNLQQQLQDLQHQQQLPLPVPPQFNQQPFHQQQFQHQIVDGRPRPVPYQQHAHHNYVQQQVFQPVAEPQQMQQVQLQANIQSANAPEDIVAHANPQPQQGNGTISSAYVFATPPGTPDRRNGQTGQRLSANPAFMTPPTKESTTSRTGQQGDDTSRSVWNQGGGSNVNEGATAANGFSSIDWVIWTPSKGSAVPPSLQQQPPLLGSPNRGNASSSNEADVSGTSNNENEGEDKECDLDLSKITDEYLENIIRSLRRSPTPNPNVVSPPLTTSTGKKKKRQKKRSKRDASRRRSSPTPVFSEDRFHDEEQSSSDEECTSDGADRETPGGDDSAATPSVGRGSAQGLLAVDTFSIPQPDLTGVGSDDSDASLSGEDLNPDVRKSLAMSYKQLDQLLPAVVHKCIPETPSDIASKRQELVESPTSKLLFKDFLKQLRDFEKNGHKDGFALARFFALESLSSPGALPDKVFWRVCMEIADLAKRENLVDEAAYWFHKVNQLQPFASQGWLEHAKMEEECGRLETCQYILQTGLRFCPYNESLLVKGIKHQEQMSDPVAARSLLARLKHVRLEKSWKTILEGALFEARAGKLSIARKVFKYLIKNIPRHGPIYHEAYKLEEKCEQFYRAMEIVEKGLVANPRYGPLWFGAFRLYERMAMQEQLVAQQTYNEQPCSSPTTSPHPGHRHVRCMQCSFVPYATASGAAAGTKDGTAPNSTYPATDLTNLLTNTQSTPKSPDRRVVKSTGKGEDHYPPSSPSCSTSCSQESSPHPSPRVLEDTDTSNVSYCSSVGDSGQSACDSARSTCTSISAISTPRNAASHMHGTKAATSSIRAAAMTKGGKPAAPKTTPTTDGPSFCDLCCPHTRSLECAAALAAEPPRPIPIDLTRVRDAIHRAVKSISKELVWKVYFENAQIEERAGNIEAARQAYIMSALHALPNLRWKVWLGGARTELNCDNIDVARQLLDRALAEVPRKTRAVVLLECARLEEYAGNLDKARAILKRAHKETKHEWKVFLESILLELRAGNMQAAIEESLAALEIHRGTGRLWAVLIQLKQCEGEAEQSRVFREALKEVPKSGEVWCEGARMSMNPLSSKFNLARARQFLDFAIKFTPQYGDSFIEYLRLELLTTGHAINSQLEQLCVNAEPNYGPMWYHCKFHALNSTRHVLRTAKAMLQTEMAHCKSIYQQAIVRHQADEPSPLPTKMENSSPNISAFTFVTGLPSLNGMYRNVHSLPMFLRRKIIFGSEHITP